MTSTVGHPLAHSLSRSPRALVRPETRSSARPASRCAVYPSCTHEIGRRRLRADRRGRLTWADTSARLGWTGSDEPTDQKVGGSSPSERAKPLKPRPEAPHLPGAGPSPFAVDQGRRLL